MTVDMRACTMSKWTGKAKNCHMCDKPLRGRQRAWCSKTCYRVFNKHHHYTTARTACRRAAIGRCSCAPDLFRTVSIQGEPQRRAFHALCSKCGRCEREAGQLECNHIVPRLGNKESFSCKHHQANLEMVCHTCHLGITAEQRLTWVKKTPKKKPVAKPKTWTTDF